MKIVNDIEKTVTEAIAKINQSPQGIIDEKWHKLISGSTLSYETLCFINLLIQKTKPKSILEFGCGVSTQFICEIIKEHDDCQFYSVENIEKFIVHTKLNLNTLSNRVNFILAPIRPTIINSCLFVTYSKSFLNKLNNNSFLDLVIIDGPLGSIFRRDVPLFLIQNKLIPGSIILLDDSNRPREQEALALWKKLFGNSIKVIEVPDFHKGLAIISVREKLPHMSFDTYFRVQRIFDSMYSMWKNRDYMNRIKQLSLDK